MTATKLSFRTGTKSDLEVLQRIYKARGGDATFGIAPPTDRVIKAPKKYSFIVACNNRGELVGFANLSFKPGGIVNISSMGLLPQYAGLGKELLLAAEKHSISVLARRKEPLNRFELFAAVTRLRAKAGREDFVKKELELGRSAHQVRTRWFKMQGYSPARLGSHTLVKKAQKR